MGMYYMYNKKKVKVIHYNIKSNGKATPELGWHNHSLPFTWTILLMEFLEGEILCMFIPILVLAVYKS